MFVFGRRSQNRVAKRCLVLAWLGENIDNKLGIHQNKSSFAVHSAPLPVLLPLSLYIYFFFFNLYLTNKIFDQIRWLVKKQITKYKLQLCFVTKGKKHNRKSFVRASSGFIVFENWFNYSYSFLHNTLSMQPARHQVLANAEALDTPKRFCEG